MHYISTRGGGERTCSSEAIINGIAADGGLYLPESIPKIKKPLNELLKMDYRNLAEEILEPYLSDFTKEELAGCVNNAYNTGNFDSDDITPLKEAGGCFFLELFHGRTLAFKDMALSLLPYIMKTASDKSGNDKEIIILTATSGDTGKAALEGFANAEGIRIMVFYPENGVSDIQKLQMTTQEGSNTFVVGVNGNFDDAQTGVKKIFTDTGLRRKLEHKSYMFSSANSINIGRLLPQIVYYFYAYGKMVSRNFITAGEKINFTVPTGNFGNILAGYYAREMGLPVNMLICASNENKVLYDFFRTGEYNRNRELVLTSSPSMDILVSSNLERLLFHESGDASYVKSLMENLNKEKKYRFDINIKGISGQFAERHEADEAIREAYLNGYLMDTHTAVAYAAYRKYLNETGDSTKNIILATASPFKFPVDVCSAINPGAYDGLSTGDMVGVLEKLAGCSAPERIRDIYTKKIRHTTVCGKDEMADIVENMLL